MKRMSSPIAALLALLALTAVSSCAKKTEQAAKTGSDSLLASNPVEQPQGSLTPQATPQPAPETPAPAPKKAPAEHAAKKTEPHAAAAENPGVMIPAGTGINVKVGVALTSETANAGDTWSGTVSEPVVIGTAAPIPAGSVVSGVIEAAKPAKKGDRAMLLLGITSVTVNGKDLAIHAVSDSLIAGSTRARNVGATAGGAAAGALIGSAIGGGKGALIGGLLGGGTAAGVAASSKGYQVTVAQGAPIAFHVSHDVTVKE
jgi:hypothetical protein